MYFKISPEVQGIYHCLNPEDPNEVTDSAVYTDIDTDGDSLRLLMNRGYNRPANALTRSLDLSNDIPFTPEDFYRPVQDYRLSLLDRVDYTPFFKYMRTCSWLMRQFSRTLVELYRYERSRMKDEVKSLVSTDIGHTPQTHENRFSAFLFWGEINYMDQVANRLINDSRKRERHMHKNNDEISTSAYRPTHFLYFLREYRRFIRKTVQADALPRDLVRSIYARLSSHDLNFVLAELAQRDPFAARKFSESFFRFLAYKFNYIVGMDIDERISPEEIKEVFNFDPNDPTADAFSAYQLERTPIVRGIGLYYTFLKHLATIIYGISVDCPPTTRSYMKEVLKAYSDYVLPFACPTTDLSASSQLPFIHRRLVRRFIHALALYNYKTPCLTAMKRIQKEIHDTAFRSSVTCADTGAYFEFFQNPALIGIDISAWMKDPEFKFYGYQFQSSTSQPSLSLVDAVKYNLSDPYAAEYVSRTPYDTRRRLYEEDKFRRLRHVIIEGQYSLRSTLKDSLNKGLIAPTATINAVTADTLLVPSALPWIHSELTVYDAVYNTSPGWFCGDRGCDLGTQEASFSLRPRTPAAVADAALTITAPTRSPSDLNPYALAFSFIAPPDPTYQYSALRLPANPSENAFMYTATYNLYNYANHAVGIESDIPLHGTRILEVEYNTPATSKIPYQPVIEDNSTPSLLNAFISVYAYASGVAADELCTYNMWFSGNTGSRTSSACLVCKPHIFNIENSSIANLCPDLAPFFPNLSYDNTYPMNYIWNKPYSTWKTYDERNYYSAFNRFWESCLAYTKAISPDEHDLTANPGDLTNNTLKFWPHKKLSTGESILLVPNGFMNASFVVGMMKAASGHMQLGARLLEEYFVWLKENDVPEPPQMPIFSRLYKLMHKYTTTMNIYTMLSKASLPSSVDLNRIY